MSRPFGSKATLNNKPVVWGGDDYGWQSPASFSTIPEPSPIRKAGDRLQEFIGGLIPGNREAAASAPVITTPYGPGGSPSGSGLGQVQQDPPAIAPERKSVSDTISYAEGTWDADKQQPRYDVRYGDKPDEATLDVTKPHPMNVRNSAYGSPFASNASGAFQFLDTTWRDMNDGQNAVMSPINQDKAVNRLIESTGYDYDKPFGPQTPILSGRWASLPNEEGVSRYDQPVPHTPDELNDFQQQRLQQLEEENRLRVYNNRQQ